MAGNIVPAIATANAMVGGQIVIHALRILRGQFQRCQTVYLREMPNHKGVLMMRDKKLVAPNPKCTVCSTEGQIVLSTDIQKFTVRQLEDLVLKKKLNVVAPDVLLNMTLIISSDEDDELDLYSQTLEQVGVRDGSRLSVDDYFQNYSIKISVHHKEHTQEEDPEFEIFGDLDELKKSEQDKDENNEKKDEQDDDNDCIIEMPGESNENIDEDKVEIVSVDQTIKRKADEIEEDTEPKKIRMSN